MKPKIGIGITTYKDISDPRYGRALFDAYAAVSPRLAPSQVSIGSARYELAGPSDLADHWATLTPFELRDGRTGPIIERGSFNWGAEWRTKGALSGVGSVHFRPDRDPNGSSEVIIEHNYSKAMDWLDLFQRLVACFEPSHAMLHLFSARELARAHEGERFAFNGPIAGEAHFTTWLSSIGDWRQPDLRHLEERRRYRHLPELAWANVLGAEFAGRYDQARLADLAARAHLSNGVAYAQVTDQVSDVLLEPDKFEEARARLRTAFATDVFRA